MPVITPVALTVAIDVLAEDQVPPIVASDNVAVAPTQATFVPPIATGNGYTVTIAVTRQPLPIVYDILDVPFAMPVTTPAEFIVA
jgi:hypothetical protein